MVRGIKTVFTVEILLSVKVGSGILAKFCAEISVPTNCTLLVDGYITLATVGAVKTGTIIEPVFEVADGGVVCGVVSFTLLTVSADFSVDLLVGLALVTVVFLVAVVWVAGFAVVVLVVVVLVVVFAVAVAAIATVALVAIKIAKV